MLVGSGKPKLTEIMSVQQQKLFFHMFCFGWSCRKQQVEFFEPFWDSGEPRIGEKGARGWKAWMHQQEKGGWVVLKPGMCVSICVVVWLCVHLNILIRMI